MRIAMMAVLGACLAALPDAHGQGATPAPAFTLVDLTGAYAAFYDRTQGMEARPRVEALKAEFAPLFPGFYDAARVKGFASPERYDVMIARSFGQFADLRPRYARTAAAFAAMLAPARDDFARHFPDLAPIGDVHLVHSLGEMDGGLRTIGGRRYFVFGADVMAQLYAPGDERPFFQHELFHIYHRQFFGECPAVWCALWAEGLAVYVSERLNPGASDAQMGLTVPRPIRPEVDADRARAVCAVRARFDSEKPDDYAPLFYGASHLPGLPPRFAYYVGYLVAREAARARSLQELAHLTAEEARPVAAAALAALAECATTTGGKARIRAPADSSSRAAARASPIHAASVAAAAAKFRRGTASVQRLRAKLAATGEVRARARQLLREVAQRRAQPFLKHRVVDRHAQEVGRCEALPNRERQQVRHVLGRRYAHLGPQQAPVAAPGVDAHEAPVALRDPGPSLILEVRLADHGRLRVESGVAPTDHGDGGIREDDRQRRATPVACALVGDGVPARDVAVVRRFVEQRRTPVDVAGDEHRQVGDPHRLRFERRHAVRVEGHAERLEAQAVHGRAAADGDQHAVDAHFDAAGAQRDPCARLGQLDVGAGVDRELARENGARDTGHPVVGQLREVRAVPERADFDAEPSQCLRHLDADGAESDDAHARGQARLLEEVVGRQHAFAERPPRRRYDGM